MATLIIWAYSILVQFAKLQEELQAAPSSETEQPATPAQDEELYSELNIIYIDRLCDDEMVQLYLRHGDKMSAHMARVGVITEASAPSRILREGIRLLENGTAGGRDRPETGSWGVDETYMEVLAALVQAMEQRPT